MAAFVPAACAPASHCWWTQPLIRNPLSAPSPRQGHAAAYLNNAVYVFGGVDGSGALLGDMHRLELGGEGLTWVPVSAAGTQPSPRAGAILLPLGKNTGAVPLSQTGASLPVTAVDKLLLFGGLTKAGASNDLFVLDLAHPTPKWFRVVSSGTEVTPRYHAQSHVVCQSDGSLPRLIVTGGEINDEKVSQTVVLDLTTWTWSLSDIHAEDGAILARSRGCTLAQNGCMVVLGGEMAGAALCDEALCFDAVDNNTPALPVARVRLDRTSQVPPPRILATVTTVRSDGRLQVDENAPNALALGAVQPYGSTQFIKRKSQLNLDIDIGDSSATSSAPGEPGSSDGSAAAPVTHCGYLIGGCTPLATEARFSDVWRVVVDEEENHILYQAVMSEGPRPIARADHIAVAIPSSDASASSSSSSSSIAAMPGTTSGEASPNGGVAACVNRILVFGGSSGPGLCLNDVLILEISASPLPEFSSETMSPRAAQQAGQQPQQPAVGQSAACCAIQ